MIGRARRIAGLPLPARSRRQTGEAFLNQLLLEKPCTNHGYPVNHKFKDCDMMKRLLHRTAKSNGDGRDKQPDADQDKEKPAEGSFPEVDRCLVIIGGLEDECSRR